MQTLQKQTFEPIGLLIAAARSRIRQAVGDRVGAFGLSPPQFWVVIAIKECPGLSLRELARRIRIDEPTASRVVRTLAARRLILVASDEHDARRSVIELTAAGHRLAGDVHPVAREIRSAIVRGLGIAEQRRLRMMLRRVIENMESWRPDRTA